MGNSRDFIKFTEDQSSIDKIFLDFDTQQNYLYSNSGAPVVHGANSAGLEGGTGYLLAQTEGIRIGNTTYGNVVVKFPSPTQIGGSYYLRADGEWVVVSGSGGNASPSGSNGSIQFNDSGTMGGQNSFKFDKTTNTLTIGTISLNSTYSGVSSDSSKLNGQNADYYATTASLSGYQTVAGLSGAVGALSANDSIYLNGQPASYYATVSSLGSYATITSLSAYQTTAGLSGNVATLTANNTSFVGTTSAANVVSNTQLQSNLANYQTTAGLSSNVATLTSNNTSFVGTTSAANVVSNTQLQSNLANYQTTAGLSSNVATLTSNDSIHAFGKTESNLNVNSSSSSLTSNNSTYFGGQLPAYYATAASLSGANSNIRNVLSNVSNTSTLIDQANATGIYGIEYSISAKDNVNNNYKISRISLTTDGTNSYTTEYAIVQSNSSASVCTYSSQISGGNVQLLGTGDSSNVSVVLNRIVLGSVTNAGDVAQAYSSNAIYLQGLQVASTTDIWGNISGVLSTQQVANSLNFVTLTPGASTTSIDCSSGINFQFTLANNQTLLNPTNLSIGRSGIIRVIQDATGSRTLGFSSNYKFDSDTPITIGSTSNKSTYLTYLTVNSTCMVLSLSAKNVT